MQTRERGPGSYVTLKKKIRLLQGNAFRRDWYIGKNSRYRIKESGLLILVQPLNDLGKITLCL